MYGQAMQTLVVRDADPVSADDAYRAYVVAKIQRGLDDIDAGRTFSDEEVEIEMEAFFDALENGTE